MKPEHQAIVNQVTGNPILAYSGVEHVTQPRPSWRDNPALLLEFHCKRLRLYDEFEWRGYTVHWAEKEKVLVYRDMKTVYRATNKTAVIAWLLEQVKQEAA